MNEGQKQKVKPMFDYIKPLTFFVFLIIVCGLVVTAVMIGLKLAGLLAVAWPACFCPVPFGLAALAFGLGLWSIIEAIH